MSAGQFEPTQHTGTDSTAGPREGQHRPFAQSFAGQVCIVLGVIVATAVVVTIGFARSSSGSEESTGGPGHPLVATAHHGNPDQGRRYFMTTCVACHGPAGTGLPNLGANLKESKFVASHTDADLVAFIRKGRLPGDPNSVMGGVMPPNGANPAITEQGLYDVVAYVRTIQGKPGPTAPAGGATPAAGGAPAPAPVSGG